MDHTATQHAGIAAESVNALNWRLLATLEGEDGADVTGVKDVYDVTTSVKLLTQRLGLTYSDLGRIVDCWHEEGRLVTADATDPDTQVDAFRGAMAAASTAARDMLTALDRATDALGPVGWRKDATTEEQPRVRQHGAPGLAPGAFSSPDTPNG